MGFGPCILLKGKWGKKVGAVIVPAAKDSKELEGACHSVGYIFLSLSVCTLGKRAAVSHRDVMGIDRLRLMRHCNNGNHASG